MSKKTHLCPHPPPPGNLLCPVSVNDILPVAQVKNPVVIYDAPFSHPHIKSIRKTFPSVPSTSLQSHWPPCRSSNTPGTLLPCGLCTDWSLCLVSVFSWHPLSLNIPFPMKPTLPLNLDGKHPPCQHLQSPLFCSFFFTLDLLLESYIRCLCRFFSICLYIYFFSMSSLPESKLYKIQSFVFFVH